jgi:hypothetical protein
MVAHGMSQTVVDGFETVQIDEKQRHEAVVTIGPRHGAGYATFRSFPKNETECLVHLFGHPSALPLLDGYLAAQAPTSTPHAPSGGPSDASAEHALVEVDQTGVGGDLVPSVDARDLQRFWVLESALPLGPD